jgi:hypothetical protein
MHNEVSLTDGRTAPGLGENMAEGARFENTPALETTGLDLLSTVQSQSL